MIAPRHDGSARPAVVVVAFDRPGCLERLLRSLERAHYPEGPVPLIISVDGARAGTLRVANEFQFTHGPKTIIPRETRMGLVAHVMACGDLAETYGSVVVLEDDLLVSPHFYPWATKALNFYAGDPAVGGISLYRYSVSESTPAPFEPLDDGSDVHFIQFASSWGQAWTWEQWRGFREWDTAHTTEEKEALLPGFVQRWTGPGWKRRFIAYLIATDRYFAFPPISLSTNFGDPGTSSVTPGLYQVSLERRLRDYRFARLSESRAVYDAYFEITPPCLETWTDALRGYSYDVDLYGMKSLNHLRSEHVLTTRAGDAVKTFGLSMVPNIANVIDSVAGKQIRLVARASVDPAETKAGLHHSHLASVVDVVFPRNDSAKTEAAPPYLSLLSVEGRTGDASGIRRSVNAQRHPRRERMDTVEHVVVGAGFEPGPEDYHERDGPSLAARYGPAELSGDELILWGLSFVRGEVMGCLPPGSVLAPGALFQIESIFRAFPSVSWLAGLPGSSSPLRDASTRDSPHTLMSRLRHFGLDWAGVFWRRSLWRQAMAGRDPVRDRSQLWARMAEEASLQVAIHVFVSTDPARLVPPELPASAPSTPPRARSVSATPPPLPLAPSSSAERRLLRRLLTQATEPLFLNDVRGLSFLHTATHLAPYIRLWDSATGRVTLWHYPQEVR